MQFDHLSLLGSVLFQWYFVTCLLRCTLIDTIGHMIGRVTGVPGHMIGRVTGAIGHMIGRVTGAIGHMIDLNGCLLASHGLTQLTSSSQAAETGDVHRLCVE